jgi:hypothetical protein
VAGSRCARRQTYLVSKQVFTGGLRTSGLNATFPFARLAVAEDGITLRLFGIVHTRSQWSEVVSAQRVIGGLLGSPGVRIALEGGRQFVFWHRDPQRVLDALSRLGVLVLEVEGRPPKVWFGS